MLAGSELAPQTEQVSPIPIADELVKKEMEAFLIACAFAQTCSSVCDRVLFIDQGTIVQQGGVADLQSNPANERVRGFFDMLDRAR